MAKYPVISSDPEIQKQYVQLRKKGNTHVFAEMCALRKPPRFRDTYSPMHPRRGRGQGGPR